MAGSLAAPLWLEFEGTISESVTLTPDTNNVRSYLPPACVLGCAYCCCPQQADAKTSGFATLIAKDSFATRPKNKENLAIGPTGSATHPSMTCACMSWRCRKTTGLRNTIAHAVGVTPMLLFTTIQGQVGKLLGCRHDDDGWAVLPSSHLSEVILDWASNSLVRYRGSS